jgi:hypothetical protein
MQEGGKDKDRQQSEQESRRGGTRNPDSRTSGADERGPRNAHGNLGTTQRDWRNRPADVDEDKRGGS